MRKQKAGAAPDMRRCADCAHHFGAADPGCYRAVLPACVYILDTGRRRPCPAGEGCTEYELVSYTHLTLPTILRV